MPIRLLVNPDNSIPRLTARCAIRARIRAAFRSRRRSLAWSRKFRAECGDHGRPRRATRLSALCGVRCHVERTSQVHSPQAHAGQFIASSIGSRGIMLLCVALSLPFPASQANGSASTPTSDWQCAARTCCVPKMLHSCMEKIGAPTLTARFYRSDAGVEPLRDWLKSLPVIGRKAIGEDVKTVQFGWPPGMPLVAHLGNGIREVRTRLSTRVARVLFVLDGAAASTDAARTFVRQFSLPIALIT